MNKKPILIVLQWLIALLVAPLLLITAIRILLTPLFPRIEYRMPGFPVDMYGFTLEERTHWSAYAVNYLVNQQPVAYLGDLTFDDGEALYNARELSHMVDVKNLVQATLKYWVAGLIVLAGTAVVLMAFRQKQTLLLGLKTGGWLTVGLLTTVLLLVAINFDQLFTWFHQLFFTDETWLFYESDTLIRLFPLPLWRDAFIFVGVFSMVSGLLLALLIKRPAKG